VVPTNHSLRRRYRCRRAPVRTKTAQYNILRLYVPVFLYVYTLHARIRVCVCITVYGIHRTLCTNTIL
jgi:hypothetical protein